MKFRLKQIFKMLCQHIIFPFIYMINRWRKTDRRTVIFADARRDNCPPYMRQIHDTLSGGDLNIIDYFHDLSAVSATRGFRIMARFMKLYAGAGCVLICDNYLPVSSCKKKKDTRVIQLWHGCGAFKKFGFDAADDIPSFYRGNVYKNYDLVTVSGDGAVYPFSHAMRAAGNIVRATGVSYTDRLFSDKYIGECKDRFRYLYPDAAGKKVVLWAPTFRGNAAMGKLIGAEYIDALSEDNRADLYIVKSLHPHLLREEARDLSGTMTTDELIVCADILITDYSSVFFEFLLTDKPIIFFAPDYREYVKNRGFYQDYDELPGYVIKGNRNEAKRKKMDVFMLEELKKTVASALENDTMANLRRSFRDKYMNACDGNATGRIIEAAGFSDYLGGQYE